MHRVFQVSQGTQEKSERAIALLSSEKDQLQALPRGCSPADWEGEPH